MRYFHKTQNKFFRPVINVDKLWSLVSEQTRTRYASDPDGKAPVIDCVRSVRTAPPTSPCDATHPSPLPLRRLTPRRKLGRPPVPPRRRRLRLSRA